MQIVLNFRVKLKQCCCILLFRWMLSMVCPERNHLRWERPKLILIMGIICQIRSVSRKRLKTNFSTFGGVALNLVFTNDGSTIASISPSIRQVKTSSDAQASNAIISASTRKRKKIDPCICAWACAFACVEPVFPVKEALLCLWLCLHLCLRR